MGTGNALFNFGQYNDHFIVIYDTISGCVALVLPLFRKYELTGNKTGIKTRKLILPVETMGCITTGKTIRFYARISKV